MSHRANRLPLMFLSLVARFALGCAPGEGAPTDQSAQPIVVCRRGRSPADEALTRPGLVQCVPMYTPQCLGRPADGPNADDCTLAVEPIERLPSLLQIAPEVVWLQGYDAAQRVNGQLGCDHRVDGCGPFYLHPDALLPRRHDIVSQPEINPAWEQRPEWGVILRSKLRSDAGVESFETAAP